MGLREEGPLLPQKRGGHNPGRLRRAAPRWAQGSEPVVTPEQVQRVEVRGSNHPLSTCPLPRKPTLRRQSGERGAHSTALLPTLRDPCQQSSPYKDAGTTRGGHRVALGLKSATCTH